MYYDDNLVEEIRSRSDIVDVISGYISLKGSGSQFSACCPFHNEKTPSFNVSRTKQIYKCFGCGAGGNVYSFLMAYENLSFPEAVELLAGRAGIKLPEKHMSEEQRRRTDRIVQIKDMNSLAARYFHGLLKSARGAKGMEYLKSRGLTDETIVKFGLGYADMYRDDLYKYLKAEGYSDNDLKDSGLVRFDEKYGGSDCFWNRVMFPIIDKNKRVIGFGGRVMGEGKPKYLNTNDTEAFNKRRNLYGFNIAQYSRRKGFIFCEGYMDVISMHQAGFDNAVASLGTALTEEQVRLIKNFNKSRGSDNLIYLAYDSDGAGVTAARKAVQLMLQFEMPSRVISLNPYKDPDELIQKEGAQEFERRVEHALDGVLFEIDVLQSEYDQDDPQERTRFQQKAAQFLAMITDPLERGNYIRSIAERYHIEADVLKETVTRYGTAHSERMAVEQARQGQRMQRTDNRSADREDKYYQAERMLITWMMNEKLLFEKLSGIISPDDFSEPVYHDIVKEMFEQYEKNGEAAPAVILNRYQTKEENRKAFMIMQQDITKEEQQSAQMKSKAVTELVQRIKRKSIDSQIAASRGNMEKTFKLIDEKSHIDKIYIDMC